MTMYMYVVDFGILWHRKESRRNYRSSLSPKFYFLLMRYVCSVRLGVKQEFKNEVLHTSDGS